MANHSCLMIKYSKDDRYSKEDISTHDKLITRATSCSELKTISDQAKSFGVIGIDEGQFVCASFYIMYSVWLGMYLCM